MNSHLSYFKSYSKTDRDYQLENDLTRALALCLKRDHLLLHEVLRYIMKDNESIYNRLFNQRNQDPDFEIDIQRRAKDVDEFEELFAVSITGTKLDINKFNSFNLDQVSDQTPDMYIKINNVAIIFETKPNNTDCTEQLYKQTVDAIANNGLDTITPIAVDLNWKDLMELVVRVANFENTLGLEKPLINDFINYIKKHRYNWLPEIPFSDIDFNIDKLKAHERLETAMEVGNLEPVKGRLGFNLDLNWARELLFDFTKKGLVITIWPGNTKGQGKHILHSELSSKFKDSIVLNSKHYPTEKFFHIKISDAYAGYISSLNGKYDELNRNIFDPQYFWKYSGRKEKSDWSAVCDFFDQVFSEKFNWKEKANWKKIKESNRSKILISFGHQIRITIPFEDLRKLDKKRDNIQPFVDLLESLKFEFENILNDPSK